MQIPDFMKSLSMRGLSNVTVQWVAILDPRDVQKWHVISVPLAVTNYWIRVRIHARHVKLWGD